MIRARPLLRSAHAWTGLAVSLLLLALSASGSALVYKDAYWRLVYPELRAAAQVPTAEEQAAAIAAAEARFGEELRLLEMPRPGVPAYHAFLADGEALLAADDFGLIDRWRPTERFMPWLFDLHAHLLTGDRGQVVGGAVALLGALLVGTGAILWWPTRRRAGLRTLLPRNLERAALIQLHRDLGLYTLPILAILLLTGAGIVFYGGAGVVLNGLFGDPPMASVPAPPSAEVPIGGAPDAATLATVHASFEEVRLVRYHRPARGAELQLLRLKQSCELHPNGRTYVYTDGAGRIVRTADGCSIPPGQKALHAIYPLHAGRVGSDLYRLVTFLGGLALSVVSATGAFSYLRRLTTASP